MGPFLLAQKRLHWELQAILLLLTGRVDIAIVLFAIIFLPGVLVHELSHFLAARILGVTTGNFSILPKKLADGRLQLGYIETGKVDFLRESLIGIAPLIMGSTIVAYISFILLDITPLWEIFDNRSFTNLRLILNEITGRSDYLIWIYLLFAISSTMTPSSSDRRGWFGFVVLLFILVLLILWVGAGPWLLATFSVPLAMVFRSLSIVVGAGLLIHVTILLPLFFLRIFLSRIRGLRVV